MKDIAFTNRYEGLVDEPVDLSNLEDAPEPEKSNDRNRKLKKIRNRKIGVHNVKKGSWLTQFETKNPFQILEDIQEEEIL